MADQKDITWFDRKMKDIQDQFSDFLKLAKDVKPHIEAIKIIVIYLLVGGLWILLSDKVLGVLIKDPDALQNVQLYKGWLYVIVTGIVFYWIICKTMMMFKRAIDKIFQGYEELSTANEELIAMEEELSQQNDELEQHRNALMVSNQRYQLAVEGAHDGIWDWDIRHDTYFFSLKWKATFGYKEEELPNTFETWKQLLHPEDKERSINAINGYLMRGNGIYENTYRLRCKDGTYRWILSRGKAVWDEKGRAVRVAGSHTDITEHIQLQEYLRREKELSANIIRDTSMMIIVLDKDGTITQFNPFAEKVTGYQKEEVIGRNVIDVLIPNSNKEDIKDMFDKVVNCELVRNQENEIICKDGQYATILWNNNLLHDQEENILGIVLIGMDITERKEMEKRLHSLAYYDILTQLPNRTMFEEKIEQLLHNVKEAGRKVAVIYIDVDNFKHINDTMGHRTGDKFIVYIANILKYHIQHPNMVARLSGDEFVIVLTDIHSANDVILELNDLLKHIRRPWVLKNQEFFVSVSMGIAIYPEHGEDFTTLLQNADTAMFHTKENGKDGFCFYTSDMHEKTLDYIQLRSQLRHAIKNQEFMLYYQPQIDLKSGQLIGVEVLIRWLHPEKGFVLPTEFIPMAEKMGYIREIGEWVLKTACDQKKQWEQKGYIPIKMAINLSSKHLTDHDFIKTMKKAIEQENINCSEIELEITETAVMDNMDIALDAILHLRDFGFSIALDDFGTGYSSLTYLQKLPIDILKIDREFIRQIAKKDKEHFLITSIIQLAHNLNMKVVAEGIETKEQEEFLTKYHCDIGQGYYYSKPVSAKGIEKILSKI